MRKVLPFEFKYLPGVCWLLDVFVVLIVGTVEVNQVDLKEGDIGSHVYIIISGEFEVIKSMHGSTKQRDRELKVEAFLGP